MEDFSATASRLAKIKAKRAAGGRSLTSPVPPSPVPPEPQSGVVLHAVRATAAMHRPSSRAEFDLNDLEEERSDDDDQNHDKPKTADQRAQEITDHAMVNRHGAVERAKREAEEKAQRAAEQRRMQIELLEQEFQAAAERAREDAEAMERREARERGGAAAENLVRKRQIEAARLRKIEEEKEAERLRLEAELLQRLEEDERRREKLEAEKRARDEIERQRLMKERAEAEALGLPDPRIKAEKELDKILNVVSLQQAEFQRYSEGQTHAIAARAIAARKSLREAKLASGSEPPPPPVAAAVSRRKRTAMIFMLPPKLGTFTFHEPGRRLLLLRSIKHIDLWQSGFDLPSVVLALFTDIAFLSRQVEDGVFELLHRPLDRKNVSATEAPAVYGARVIKVTLGKNQHLLEAATEKEAKFWLKRLNMHE